MNNKNKSFKSYKLLNKWEMFIKHDSWILRTKTVRISVQAVRGCLCLSFGAKKRILYAKANQKHAAAEIHKNNFIKLCLHPHSLFSILFCPSPLPTVLYLNYRQRLLFFTSSFDHHFSDNFVFKIYVYHCQLVSQLIKGNLFFFIIIILNNPDQF